MAENNTLPLTSEASKATAANTTISCTSRLKNELMSLMTNGTDEGISAFPAGDNIQKWIATLIGPAGTFYANQKYHLAIEFSNLYPYVAPTVRFTTPCFHPNVEPTSGAICLDILYDKWSALMDVRSILLSIQSLLGDPNIGDPLNAHAARLWNQPAEYKEILENFTANRSTEQKEVENK